MRVSNHRLLDGDGRPVRYVESPNRGGVIVPRILVVHYTAGSTLAGAVSWLTNRRSEASAHLVIDRDGTIVQLVPLNRKAWHAGRSQYQSRHGVNDFSIGIELVNCGPLARTAAGYAFGDRRIPDDHVVLATHKHETRERPWHAFTNDQLEVAAQVARTVVRHYALQDVVGHEDVSPGRKIDPGPAFPARSFYSRALGRNADGDPGFVVTADALNVRSGPGIGFPTVEGSPLQRDARVTLLAESGTWWRVLAEASDVEGWVHSRYCKPLRRRP